MIKFGLILHKSFVLIDELDFRENLLGLSFNKILLKKSKDQVCAHWGPKMVTSELINGQDSLNGRA